MQNTRAGWVVTRAVAILLAYCTTTQGAMELACNQWFFNDWSGNWVYKDLMRQGRRWKLFLPGKADSWSCTHKDSLQYLGAPTDKLEFDAEGYPLEVTPDGYIPCTMLMADLHDNPVGSMPLGTYTVTFQGTGEVWVYVGKATQPNLTSYKIYNGSGPRATYTFELTAADLTNARWISVRIRSSQRGDHIRDLHVVLPDSSGGTSNAQTFREQPLNPLFVADMRPFTTLRMMDWCRVMRPADATREWSKRPIHTRIKQALFLESYPFGDEYQPWEWMIDMANAMHKDVWLCVHHGTTQEYWTGLAQLVKERLDPSLKLYMEYSNEVWAANYQAYDYIEALPEKAANGWNHAQAHTFRALQVAAAFDAVFGAGSERLVNVLCGWKRNATYNKTMLEALSSNSINPARVTVDAFATTAYFAGDASTPTMMQNAIAEDIADIAATATHVRASGLPYISYEGGFHCVKNCAMLARLDEVYTVYRNWLTEVEKYMTMFNHYASVAVASYEGHWGLKEFNGQPLATAPKYRALWDYGVSHNQFDPAAPLPGYDVTSVAAEPALRAAPAAVASAGTSTRRYTLDGRLMATRPVRGTILPGVLVIAQRNGRAQLMLQQSGR